VKKKARRWFWVVRCSFAPLQFPASRHPVQREHPSLVIRRSSLTPSHVAGPRPPRSGRSGAKPLGPPKRQRRAAKAPPPVAPHLAVGAADAGHRASGGDSRPEVELERPRGGGVAGAAIAGVLPRATPAAVRRRRSAVADGPRAPELAAQVAPSLGERMNRMRK
jgi:hypothetical protein